MLEQATVIAAEGAGAPGNFRGRVVAVTGAASGIGAAIAQAFAAAGASVYGLDVNERAVPGVEFIRADVSNPEQVKRAFARCGEIHGRLDVLVNNAGLFASLTPAPIDALSLEDWRRVLDVNLTGAFLCTQAAVPLLRAAGGGAIVNITSSTVFVGAPMLLHYVASKGALTAMTKSLARELGPDGITVNAIAPGFTLSDGVIARSKLLGDIGERARAGRSLCRDQTPDDIVGAALFLAGPKARFITGQTLVVDGGDVMR